MFFLQIIFQGCDNKAFLIENNNRFKEYKLDFSDTLINQFPVKILYPVVDIVSNTNLKKNDIGLLLYEYDVKVSDIKNLRKKIIKEAIQNYKSKDSCFLIVNRFETEETYSKFEVVEINDSLIDKHCNENLLPIPNFIASNYPKNKNDLNLDDSFEIFVLESKPGKHFKNFDVQPSLQMPKKWKNGFSKGIAISEKNRVVIYWSIIW